MTSEQIAALEAMAQAIHGAADNTFAPYEAMREMRIKQAAAALGALSKAEPTLNPRYEQMLSEQAVNDYVARSKAEPVATVISYKPMDCIAEIKWQPLLNGHPPFDIGTLLYAAPQRTAKPPAWVVEKVNGAIHISYHDTMAIEDAIDRGEHTGASDAG